MKRHIGGDHLPHSPDGGVDEDRYALHVRWLVESGCDEVVPNGSRGECRTLWPGQRTRVVEFAVSGPRPGMVVVTIPEAVIRLGAPTGPGSRERRITSSPPPIRSRKACPCDRA